MYIFSLFRKIYPDLIAPLPLVPDSYTQKHSLVNKPTLTSTVSRKSSNVFGTQFTPQHM